MGLMKLICALIRLPMYFPLVIAIILAILAISPVRAADPKQSKRSESRIHVLEIAGSFIPMQNLAGGPQSIPSILNSIRIASSFLDPLDGVAFAQEAGSSQRNSSFSPRIQYSHSFSENFYVGLTYAKNEKSSNTRNFIFTNGLIQSDRTTYGVDEIGFKIGLGPLNYLTNDISHEFIFSYSELNSRGPYNSLEFRSPLFNLTGSELTGYALGMGQVEYRTKTYGIGTGFSVSMLDWLNFYFLSEMGFFTGQLKLSSFSQEWQSTAQTATGFQSANTQHNQFIGFQSKSGISGFVGMNFLMEMGLVWKIWDTIGVKYGAFYQFNYFHIGEINGIQANTGRAPIQLDTVPDLTSALRGKEIGNWGATIAIVKNI